MDDQRLAPAVRGGGEAREPLDLGVDLPLGDDDRRPQVVLARPLAVASTNRPLSC